MENVSQFNTEEEEEGSDHLGVHLVTLRWEEIGPFVLILTFVIFSGLAKIVFHHMHFLSSRIPESCLLVIVGLGFGALYNLTEDFEVLPEFSTELFFHYLLPPIILEAAYSLHHTAFLENLRCILLFAVVGTAFNFLLIGGLLVGVNELGLMSSTGIIEISVNGTEDMYAMKSVEIFTFASLISAVDPVAVLAIFQEIGVNSELYYIVFGESLLNDGVAVVFYNMMNSFAELDAAGEEITAEQIILGCVSFLSVALGGLTIGILVGLLTGLITRTTAEVSIVEPLIVMGMALVAYFLSEMFHWSGIISLIGCGITQAHYSFRNIHENSLIAIDYFSKMLSSTMDSVIFLYLGKALLGKESGWAWQIHTGFICWTLVLCLVVRFVGVYSFCFILNRFRVKPINLQEQFIMAYGGLRGAVGFSLVISIKNSIVPTADMLVSTTLIVVMFTIGLQGSTIKPLVNILNIDKEKDEGKTLLEELNDTTITNINNGINRIIGRFNYSNFVAKFNQFDEHVLMKIFCVDDMDHGMKKLFEEREMKEHLANVYDPKRSIKKTMQYINEGFERDTDSIDRTVATGPPLHHVSIPGQVNSPDFLMPTRRDSLISNASAVSRRSVRRPFRTSIYGHAVSQQIASGQSHGELDAKKVLKTGLYSKQMSLQTDMREPEDGRLLNVVYPSSRKLSSVSSYANQTGMRERTFSEGSMYSNTSARL